MKIETIIVCGLMSVPMLTEAMPSKQELDKVAPVVQELMRPEQDALKAGKKTKAEVADAAIALVEQADGEAAKLLLAKGAFNLYVRDGAYDKALDTLKMIRTEVPDITPQYLVSMLESALRRVSRKKCAELYQILDETKVIARYADEVKKLDVQSRLHPENAAIKTQLAEHYVVLGDWTKALDAFEKCGNAKAASTAKNEKAGAADAKAIADFWWDYPNKKGDELEKPFKQHAATLYADAIASGKLVGLTKVQVERRIKEAESLGEAVAQAMTASGGNKLYCVIDLSAGPNAKKYPVSYLDKVPTGGWTDEYKTTKLVLRRIEPGSFEYLPGKKFKLTKQFYIGVFEVTQKQYELVCGNNPAEFKGDARPVERVSYEMIRGKNTGLMWPQTDSVDDDSFIGYIRKRTGIHFDLPTEVQWEYACRAGTTSKKYHNDGDKDSDMSKVGRYAKNGGSRNQHATVGSYLPNKWAIYDMQGNVWEWCLDRGNDGSSWLFWGNEGKECDQDPKGPPIGSSRHSRGGSWSDWSEWNCYLSTRNRQPATSCRNVDGFRLAIQPSFVPPQSGAKK